MKNTKALMACEKSQAATIEFRRLGIEAYSCDTEDCSGGHPEWHIKKDVRLVLNDGWDIIVAFPPCDHLSVAGAPYWKEKQRDGRQKTAIDFAEMFFACADCVCVENPVGILNTIWKNKGMKKQIINPYQFGDPFLKRTCLWLKGLPALIPTNIVEPKFHYTSNSTRGGLLKNGTRRKSKLPIRKAWDSKEERSKTFPGIARAIAEQWTPVLIGDRK